MTGTAKGSDIQLKFTVDVQGTSLNCIYTGAVDGILAIEKDNIGGGLGGLLEHRGVGAGHGKFRAVQSRRGLLDYGKAHGESP